MEIIRKIYLFLLDTVQTFLIAAAVFLVIYIFLFRPFEVKGESMYGTLNFNLHDKEYVITNLIALRLGHPKLGDVVVFKAPPDPSKDYIKRIIGLPGDTIFIKNGSVYINDKLLDESTYLKPDVKTYSGQFLAEDKSVKVPEGYYFVMGDNRLYSSDSREWGFVKEQDIIGQSLLVYWPLNRMRLVKNPY